jgi:hypothetical protein
VQGRWERGREQNERERVVGKAAGDECVFIPGEGPSWQIKSSDTIPEAAGGEGDHGAARPEGVIHRYRIYRQALTIVSADSGLGQRLLLG